jgi:uncharacterized protein YbjT (DUF2867 family)
MKTVFIAGATGYLGRFLCAEYSRRGWYVVALVRNPQSAAVLAADSIVTAQATDASSLKGMMDGADLVVSALGITRQVDGLSYQDVDYQANINLLREAERAGVDRFAYVHVLHADAMLHIPLAAAKAEFVEALQASTLNSTVIAPSGYFSDMGEVFAMAQAGRIWLFGSGTTRINPIHGADLASVVANATDAETAWVDAGGPDAFTQTELVDLAFKAIGRTPHITRLPDILRKITLSILPRITPQRVHGPAQFFLTACAIEMVGTAFGTLRLEDHFQALAAGLDPTSKGGAS